MYTLLIHSAITHNLRTYMITGDVVTRENKIRNPKRVACLGLQVRM